MKYSVIRIVAAVSALCAMAWLVATVNAHGDAMQQAVSTTMRASSFRIEPSRNDHRPAGLELIDMYECMCGPFSNDIELRRWLRLWLVAAIIGGIPTAILLRFKNGPATENLK